MSRQLRSHLWFSALFLVTLLLYVGISRSDNHAPSRHGQGARQEASSTR